MYVRNYLFYYYTCNVFPESLASMFTYEVIYVNLKSKDVVKFSIIFSIIGVQSIEHNASIIGMILLIQTQAT